MISPIVANAEHTPVANATSAGTLLAANGRRVGVSVHNDSATADVYLLLDNSSAPPTVSSSVFTVKLPSGGASHWEAPFGYQGAITFIASAANGNCQVTEYTV